MSYIQKLASWHNLKPGDGVVVVTSVEPNGSKKRRLFRYDTAALWYESSADGMGVKFKTTREPWDGIESVDFDNGD